MRLLFALTLCLLWGLFATAEAQSTQEEARDRSYLQGLLEDNLSAAGRDVRITGFSGALSSQASLQELTIADDDGIWLTLRDVVLDWDRSALFSRRLDVTQLTAKEIVLARLPAPEGATTPSPEARPFALPELPVAIEIRKLEAEKITLGAPLLGDEIALSLEGEIALANGEGSADISLARIDGPKAELSFQASYANATRNLALALELDEAADGIAARLLNLPGAPSVNLSIEGTGPLSDYAADVRLATDGQTRLAGRVQLTEPAAPGDETPADPAIVVAPKRIFSAEISGDIAPVFLPEYQDFFGDTVALTVAGTVFQDQSLTINALDLRTAEMVIAGALSLDATGWPVVIDVTTRIADPEGGAVLLPLPGLKTRLTQLALDFDYDAAVSDSWTFTLALDALQRDDLKIGRAQLTGQGALEKGDATLVSQVLGATEFVIAQIAPTNEKLAEALGTELTGTLDFAWAEAVPLQLTNLALRGADYRLTGVVSLDNLEDPLNLLARGDLAFQADDLTRFSALAGRLLAGRAELAVTGNIAPLSGAFDVEVTGDTLGLAVNHPQVDPLIAGQSTLDLAAQRDETGLTVPRLVIRNDAANIFANGRLATGASLLSARAQITELAPLDLGLAGSATVTGQFNQEGENWKYEVSGTGPGGAVVQADGALNFDETILQRIVFDARAEVDSLRPYAALAKRDLAGAAALTAEGWFEPQDRRFVLALDGTTDDIQIGSTVADQLLAGAGNITAELRGAGGNVFALENLRLTTRELTATVTGDADGPTTDLDIALRLRDLGVFAPGFSGPVSVQGRALQQAALWRLDLSGVGPGGTNAEVRGTLAEDASGANLSITGGAPVALVNNFIGANAASGRVSYDLALTGPLALSSLSGRVSTTDARLFIPAQQITLSPISGDIRLSGGQAVLDIAAQVTDGGRLTARGPVALSAPFSADLEITLASVALSDDALYSTTISGQADVSGPLTGGARISANLELGPTELQIPDGSAPNLAVLTDMQHVNEPADVRRTRVAAGFVTSGQGGSGGAQRAYPLDILLRAPSRIFIRGRGLDAELGGQLRLTGTSANVIPLGRFDLIRGRLDILGKRLVLSQGSAQLQGGLDPYIRLVADTEAAGTDIRIVAEGLASAPSITFTSSPELPEDEVLALLLFERNLSEISPLQALQLAAAVQTLAGGGSGLLGRLRTEFGLDDLDVTTSDSGATGVRIGKYINENIYTDVTAGSDGTSEINLNLTVTPSVTARGSVGSDGETRLGIFFERDY
ncbi:translocation/assembly module TamB domain-containing protein [Cognatishimia sp. SS12]|uniref:translocation/assembly module TamB domain-containing protein n=1 Tax=Cognatishimia sp. SS12 TaxID=2979465 RepID=UPI00233138AC|nr:translocation/assembly module TamB domain-containing protein [Cognatishimia sp. SS12]MDC0739412.1 translocation/assembly module TamB domain-containing protein [Cognatishimia sp. SS12]